LVKSSIWCTTVLCLSRGKPYHEDPFSPTTMELGDILLNKVGEDHSTLTTVTANSVAGLVANSHSQKRHRPTREYRGTAVPVLTTHNPARALNKPFDPQELEAAMSSLKPGKEAGIDDVLVEMIQVILLHKT